METDLAIELTKGIIMGAMAEAFVEYARPLMDETDGSPEALQRAMDFAMMCWNLAVFPEGERKKVLQETLRGFIQENPGEESGIARFEEIVLNMVQRHVDMFPLMHGRKRGGFPFDQDELSASLEGKNIIHVTSDEFSDDEYDSDGQPFEYALAHHAAGNQRDPRGAGRNDPCPCGSGRKFKHCCRRT